MNMKIVLSHAHFMLLYVEMIIVVIRRILGNGVLEGNDDM